MDDVRATLRPALVLLAVFTALCGVVYPLATTGVARVLFPREAEGSMMQVDGRVVGSALVGQPFGAPGHFWGRPSAVGYDARTSSGTNLGPSNPALVDAVAARVRALRDADPGNAAPIPVDLVTASGSGLDPDISPAAAYYQVPRVARARGLPEAEVRALVDRSVTGRQLGFLGDPRVNVLRLNLALDALAP